MKARLMLFVAIALLVAATPLLGQESVCALFSHLEGVDGQRVMVTGDLIISKDLAVLGAADCDNRYIFREQEWPTALSLRPSPAVTPAQLQQFQNAGVEADRLRQAGKTVSASASFSGRIRLAESGDFPAELTFDSFENLKIEALPDASTLTVIPICDLFQNLPAWKGERIAVRGEYVSTMEGAWIVGTCKGKFVTDGYRWPVALTYASPAYYSQAMARLYEANWPSTSEGGSSWETSYVNKTATFVGQLRMRSEYSVSCQRDGRYVGNGFGHLNAAAAELLVEGMRNVETTERSDTEYAAKDAAAQRCTPPDPATLCLKAESLARAAEKGCTDRVREFLAKAGIDSKNGGESMALRAAIHSGNESIVKLLVDAGAPLDPVGATRSPLGEAALSWQVGIVKLLLASGAKVDSLDHHGVSFLDESHLFDPSLLKILLEAGAKVDATDTFGETVLMRAAILANRLTGEKRYLEEARRAIQVLYTVPAERLFHEPQELAYGALAAAELGMLDEAKYLLYEQLRMFYWYSDPSQKNHDTRGMVQAAASILYPAFKENMEAILPWTGVMKRGIVFEGLLRFMDRQRRNNFYFFENCSVNHKPGPSAFIPYENLGTLELAGMTGNVGKEIYGAGESIWMYLMFEALGQVSDRELMLVNLDLLDAAHMKEFPPRKLNFILYNPTPIARSADIKIPAAKERTARLSVNGKASEATLQVPRQSFVQLMAEF